MAIILITGGSGLIGQALTGALKERGHTVRWMSRSGGSSNGVVRFVWDPAAGTMDADALRAVDHVIHLSGAGIADGRWTPDRMRELYASRGGAARLLLGTARSSGHMPKTFISASGIAYYGAITSERVLLETDAPGTDTIAKLTVDWEAAADEWSVHARGVKLRTPVVLAPQGGALRKLAAPVRFGLGAALGRGTQWMPWIHIDDLVAMYVRAAEYERLHGAYNVAADEQPTNAAFMKAVARALHRPFFLPNVPAFALKAVLGELAVVLLEGSRADNAAMRATGHALRFPDLKSALGDTLR